MQITADSIIEASKILSAVGVITAAAGVIVKSFLKYKKQQKDIELLKGENNRQNEELTLICFGLSACLDGLSQLGANHTVTKARDKLDKYINNKAHKQI